MKPELKPIIVGAGGVASYLLPVLIRTFNITQGLLVDGDKLEEHNLDRQLFSKRDIGSFKAPALLKHNKVKEIKPINEFMTDDWFTKHSSKLEGFDLIIVLVDNHPARKSAIKLGQELGIPVVIGANEYVTSQAMYWHPEWDSRTRPDLRYPEMMTDRTGSPLSCQGAAQESSPQLALANQVSASLVHTLIYMWKAIYNEAKPDLYMPVEYQTTFSAIQTVTMGEIIQ